MKEYDLIYRCRVCGFRLLEPPWGEDNESPTFNFCPCCAVEFGYGDSTLFAIRSWRANWLTNGGKWDDPNLKPDNWDLAEQLRQIPPPFV